jgi:chloride channel protein, CIC family
MTGFNPSKTSRSAFNPFKHNLKTATHVALVGIPTGVMVGAAIAAYDYAVNVVLWEHFSANFSPLILSFFPIFGMVLTWGILRSFKVRNSSMADEIVKAYHDPSHGLDYRRVIPKLSASVATMGFGCSAGMEGASKWLGGAIASMSQSLLNRWPKAKLLHANIEMTMLAGAAAGIGAIFRAPLTGAIMGIESPFKKDLAHDALIHALVASAASFATFSLLRNSNPYFQIQFHYILNLRDLLFCIPVGLLAGASSHLFLSCLFWIKRKCANPYGYRFSTYLLGGVLLAAIALGMNELIGEPATLQAGLPVANRILNGRYDASTCLLIFVAKLLATAITFGFGGVGGLFVPSATIGAALGGLCDLFFQPSQPGLFTLVGIAAFTGASYNSLLFAAVFIAEATGSAAIAVPGLIASSMAYLVAAGVSNSPSQIYRRVEAPAISEPHHEKSFRQR